MKPRIFISAVTSEFGTSRQLVANVLSRLGYDPVWQDIFGTEPGDLRQVLREQIDDCDGLIQLVGRGYGAEPPTVDAEFGRVSYTQFEFLYARARGKKTWLIFADEGCTRDRPLEQLDLHSGEGEPMSGTALAAGHSPENIDPDSPVASAKPLRASAIQAERRALQEAWRQRWKQESHLFHGVSSDTDLELRVERLRDEFAEMRRAFRSWQRNVTRNLALVAVLLAAIGGGVWWTVFRQPGEVRRSVAETVPTAVAEAFQQQSPQLAQAIAEQLAAVKPDEIKVQLRKTIEATYQQEVQAADKLTEWQTRDEAKRDAAAARDKRLAQVDEFLDSITSTIKSGDASPEFLELTRIIQEQGVDPALAYIARQESRLLERAETLAAQRQRDIRRTLAPLLEGVRLHRSKGELAEARTLCDKLLKQDGDWLDVLHEHFWTMIDLGDRATQYETVNVALAHFEAAEVSAKRLVAADAQNPIWQRDLSTSIERIGMTFETLGKSTEALGQYEEMRKIKKRLAANDPSDTIAQRELSVTYSHLGDVFLTLGRTSDALTQFQDELKISRGLAEADPNDAQKHRDLSFSFIRLGDVYLTLGSTDDGLRQYQEAAKIHRVLAEADPNDARKQRDLSVSFERLGDVFLTLGRTDDALTQFQDGLKIRRVLAEADPNNARKQRNLSTSIERIGMTFETLGKSTEALGQYEEMLKIKKRLATNDPSDTIAQRELSVTYMHLGNVFLKLGRTADALTQFQDGLKISRGLAEADPNDAQKQRDLWFSHYQLGKVEVQAGHYAAARERFQAGVAVLDRMLAKKQNAAASQQDKEFLEGRLQFCAVASLATGDWDALLKTDAQTLPNLLSLRVTELAKRGQRAEVAQAAAKLRDLATSTETGPANEQKGGMLYNAARAYGLCATLTVKDKPQPTAAEQAERQKFVQQSLDCLKESLAAGYDNFEHIKTDDDLKPLRGLPEFETLFPKK